jgi:hypothetical protein
MIIDWLPYDMGASVIPGIEREAELTGTVPCLFQPTLDDGHGQGDYAREVLHL